MSLALASNLIADVPGDADHDGDVDFDDYALMALCHFGPGIPTITFCQDAFDYDLDTDLDMHDVAAFQRCFSGDTPADPGCASHIARIEDRCLHVIGTADDSVLALRLAPGAPTFLEVDVDNDSSPDFSFDRSSFDCIEIDARAGDDVVWIDEFNGIFTDTELTTIRGGDGADVLIGGAGPEHMEGGPGDDSVFLGGGDDVFIWRLGDDSDLVEGGVGIDTVEVAGSSGAEVFSVTANGQRVRFDRLSPAPFFLDIADCEDLVLDMKGGDDSLSCTGDLASRIRVTADGGPGNDTLLGSNGPDVLIGGSDNDFIDGQQGNDVVLMGPGDDVFQWDPGDGSDVVEGQADHDVIQFNGSAANEVLAFQANGQRLRFTRDVANVVLDANGVEQFNLRALGGADTVNAADLCGTAVTQVNIDLAGTLGGSTGDAQVDNVNIIGTANAEMFSVSADAGFVVVDRAAQVRIEGYEAMDQVVFDGVGGDAVVVNGSAGPDTATVVANGAQARVDVTGYSAGLAISGAASLTINGLAGPDTMSCAGNLAQIAIPITLDGGDGDDTLLGSNGADVLIGGDDNDFVDGQQGADLVFLGAGDDIFQWDPGDGSDVVEGQADHDTVVFNGSAANEIFELSANGSRLLFTRSVASVVLDANGMEQFDLRTLGGADVATLNDLTGTAVTEVNVDLAGTLGGPTGDGQVDGIVVNGTAAPDTIHIAASGGAVEVSGLPAFVRITHPEPANDTLTVNGLGGVDTITFDPGVTALIMLMINQ